MVLGQACSRENILKYVLSLLQHDQHEHFIEYNVYHPNHVAHLLISLSILGASKEKIDKAYREYIGRLEPAHAISMHVDEHNWDQHFGELKHYTSYLCFFNRMVQANGIKATINRFLPRLIDGIAGRVFHPLIHLGWALEAHHRFGGHFQEPLTILHASMGGILVPEAMAFLCYSYTRIVPLPPIETCAIRPADVSDEISLLHRPPELTPIDILLQVSASPAFADLYDAEFLKANFLDRMALVKKRKEGALRQWAAQWPRLDLHFAKHQRDFDVVVEEPMDETVSKIARSLIEAAFVVAYLTGCKDFFLLNVVTASYGMKNVLPLLTQPIDQLRLVQSAQGRPTLDTTLLAQLQSEAELGKEEVEDRWCEIISQVLSKPANEHVYKVTHAAHELSSEWCHLSNLMLAIGHMVATVDTQDFKYDTPLKYHLSEEFE